MSINKNKNIDRLRNSFGLAAGDDFVWASGANSRKVMEKICADPDVMLIEADARRNPLTGVPIMAHPPQWTSDLDFSTWMEMAISANKVMKIDFKDPGIVPELIDECAQKIQAGQITHPVLLNADILQGPAGNVSKFDAVEFIRQARKLEPDVVLSLGWTTKAGAKGKPQYTKAMVDEMIDLVRNHADNTSYTLCIRASYVKDSIENIEYLMKELPNAHLTIWGHGRTSIISPADLKWVKDRLDPERVTYDLNENKKSGLAGIVEYVIQMIKTWTSVLKEILHRPGLVFRYARNIKDMYSHK